MSEAKRFGLSLEKRLENEFETAEQLKENLEKAFKMLKYHLRDNISIDKSFIDNDGIDCVSLQVNGLIAVLITYRFCESEETILEKREEERMVFDLHEVKVYYNYPSEPDEIAIEKVPFAVCFRPMDVVGTVLRRVRQIDEDAVVNYLNTQKIKEGDDEKYD